eukprot:9470923-Ditylum_brightwellii.AAC.1
MYGYNKTHNTEDCFELKWHVKHAKPDTTWKDTDKVTYKDLNAFVNAKVTAAFNKDKKNLKKQKKGKEVELNNFNKCCTLNVESSNEDDKPKSMSPLMWTTMTVPLLVCSAILTVIAMTSEWQAMT